MKTVKPMHGLISYFLLLFCATFVRADEYERQPAIDVTHYELELELNDASDMITGTARIHVVMRQDGVDRMWLDFEGMSVDKLLSGGVERDFVHRDGRLFFQLERAYQHHEIAIVEVRYHGKCSDSGFVAGSNHYGRRVYFAENWPDHAHRWFPSIDHPSDKATVDFSITAPEKYDIVSIGRLVETRSLLDGRKLTRWSESVPVPTYCMVIGVAEFSITGAGSGSGVPLLFFAYPQDAASANRKFARSNLILQFFSGLIGPYPYEKLAQVESTTKLGGMENSSAIFYAETLFQGGSSGEFPVAHEVAHQWFGDSITPGDWDHLWLSEGFATYFDALFYEYLEGPEALKRRMVHSTEAIKRYHQDHPGPIVDTSIKAITSKLNAFNYDKGAWVLHMLRRLLGDEVFFRGIRRYYNIYSGRAILTEDFERVMESEAGKPLGFFFRQWLYQTGWPDYRVTWRWEAETSQIELTTRQTQKTGLFDVSLDVAFRCGERTETRNLRVFMESQTTKIPLPCQPDALEVDPEGWVLKDLRIASQ